MAIGTCNKCGKGKIQVRHVDGKQYCKECYIDVMWGAKTVKGYLDKHNIKYMLSTVDSHIILGRNNGVASILELCSVLGVNYWFSQGVNGQEYMHIGEEG